MKRKKLRLFSRVLALNLAKEIIDADDIKTSILIIKARELARITKDEVNYIWLTLEIEGAQSSPEKNKELIDIDYTEQNLREGTEKFLSHRDVLNPTDISLEKLKNINRAQYYGKDVPKDTRTVSNAPLVNLQEIKTNSSYEGQVIHSECGRVINKTRQSVVCFAEKIYNEYRGITFIPGVVNFLAKLAKIFIPDSK